MEYLNNDVLIYMVPFLDYETRINLSKCSSRTRQVVKSAMLSYLNNFCKRPHRSSLKEGLRIERHFAANVNMDIETYHMHGGMDSSDSSDDSDDSDERNTRNEFVWRYLQPNIVGESVLSTMKRGSETMRFIYKRYSLFISPRGKENELSKMVSFDQRYYFDDLHIHNNMYIHHESYDDGKMVGCIKSIDGTILDRTTVQNPSKDGTNYDIDYYINYLGVRYPRIVDMSLDGMYILLLYKDLRRRNKWGHYMKMYKIMKFNGISYDVVLKDVPSECLHQSYSGTLKLYNRVDNTYVKQSVKEKFIVDNDLYVKCDTFTPELKTIAYENLRVVSISNEDHVSNIPQVKCTDFEIKYRYLFMITQDKHLIVYSIDRDTHVKHKLPTNIVNMIFTGDYRIPSIPIIDILNISNDLRYLLLGVFGKNSEAYFTNNYYVYKIPFIHKN